MSYTRAMVVQRFLNIFDAADYLAVGVEQGDAFHGVTAARKVAVSSRFAFPQAARETAAGAEYHEMSSDQYFALAAREDMRFDVIYLDGVHSFDQTLRDLLNAALLIRPQGVIIVDDVIPNSFEASLPDLGQVTDLRQRAKAANIDWPTDGSWMGDVYKIPFFVDRFMQQMSFATVADNHGQTVIWREPRPGESLPKPRFSLVDRLDFRDTLIRRSEYRLEPLDVIEERVREVFDLHGPDREGGVIGRLPPETLFRRIDVAAKTMPAPVVTSPELMTELIRQDAARSWGALRAAKTLRFNRLRNVYVNAEGLVFDDRLDVYAPTIAQHDGAAVERARRALQDAVSAGTVRRLEETSVLCGKIGMANYGHWLVEMLPIAFVTRTDILSKGWKVFAPSVFPHMQAVIHDSLDLLGIPASSIVAHEGGPAWFRELVVVTGLTRHGAYYLPATADCLQEIAAEVAADGTERVWVSRAGEPRRLLHEPELQTALEAAGWRVIRPAEMTLRQQIAACKGARHVAGVDGAGMTNIGFMGSAGRVTNFIPGVMPDLFFWSLAANRGQAYHEVRCLLASPPHDPAIPWNAPLEIGIAESLAALGH